MWCFIFNPCTCLYNYFLKQLLKTTKNNQKILSENTIISIFKIKKQKTENSFFIVKHIFYVLCSEEQKTVLKNNSQTDPYFP